MCWSNRYPHTLTKGMYKAQLNLSRFLPFIDWNTFDRVNLNENIILNQGVVGFCCGSDNQAIAWILRTDITDKETGMLKTKISPRSITLFVPKLEEGRFKIIFWDTKRGEIIRTTFISNNSKDGLRIKDILVGTDIAIAIRKVLKQK